MIVIFPSQKGQRLGYHLFWDNPSRYLSPWDLPASPSFFSKVQMF